MDYAKIEKLADSIFTRLGENVPVDIVQAARQESIDIFVIQMNQMIGSDASGILVQDKKRWAIFINNDDSLTRQRFTIAHELGHFLLHKKSFVDHFTAGETFYRDGEDNFEEREANYFAACLLMPQTKVEMMWPEAKDPKDLATKFQVSEVSMTYRLKKLDLISVEE